MRCDRSGGWETATGRKATAVMVRTQASMGTREARL